MIVHPTTSSNPVVGIAAAVAAAEMALDQRGIRMTLGGEPTYVPLDPEGEEWSVAALGPTKLERALLFADSLRLPNSFRIITPGKLYPGEVNPRWVVQLVKFRQRAPRLALNDPPDGHTLPAGDPKRLLLQAVRCLARNLGLPPGNAALAFDPTGRAAAVAVLPLGHNGRRWSSDFWSDYLQNGIDLLDAEGPAGLRLPLSKLPQGALKSAFCLEISGGRLHAFIPPLGQKPFLLLLNHLSSIGRERGLPHIRLHGYLPRDERNLWTRIGFAADPGVIEVNLPPCANWNEYRSWLETLDQAAARSNLRSAKIQPDGTLGGTGGGNHILLGGPSLDENPFFTRPRWVASLCRYFQHHPSLAFLFTGRFCGPASQAPRPDESGIPLIELELAYSTLERLPPGDHRAIIADTLRNLHADASGSAHRCEISFDKFWSPSTPGGAAGLIEFRAIESFPNHQWNSAIAALLVAIAARAEFQPTRARLIDHGPSLHDFHLLPSAILADFSKVLDDLAKTGFDLSAGPWREIWEYRFPLLLSSPTGLEVRRAIEPWPLLSDIPLAGANTSRFVDSSLTRIEFSAPARLAARLDIRIAGRPLQLAHRVGSNRVAALRFRTSALHPCLHPAIPVQLPLELEIRRAPAGAADKPIAESWVLSDPSGRFEPRTPRNAKRRGGRTEPLTPPQPDLVTADLRLSTIRHTQRHIPRIGPKSSC